MCRIKTIFMGTPEFAVPSFEALINDERFDIITVVTPKDKKIGRKQILTPPPIKAKALENNIKVLQPNKLEEITAEITELKPDLAVVVAYGYIIPQSILDIPKFGFTNVHISLLPKYRGSFAGVQAPILKGEKETGVTIMKMEAGLDTGPILKQNVIVLEKDETATSLHDKMSLLGAEILPDTLVDFISGKIKPIPQDDSKASYVKMLKKEDGKIDWNKSAIEIERMVRALNPWPGTYTQIKKKNIKLLEVENNILEINNYKIGKIFLHNEKMAVQCGDGAIIIKKLQLEGKRPTEVKKFLKGHKDFVGKSF